MRRTAIPLLIGVLVGGVLGVLPPHGKAIATGPVGCWSRTEARSYTYTANHERYQIGGGWWNNNNQWDSGEGPDCSGLTFKTWAMVNSEGNTGRYYWSIGYNVHGPYKSTEFRDGCHGACYIVCGSETTHACGSSSYTKTIYMDAFAKSGHVAAIYSEGSSGWDMFVNASGTGYGINYQKRWYRIDKAYDGIRRRNWSPAC